MNELRKVADRLHTLVREDDNSVEARLLRSLASYLSCLVDDIPAGADLEETTAGILSNIHRELPDHLRSPESYLRRW